MQGTQRGDPSKLLAKARDVMQGTGIAKGKNMPTTLPICAYAVLPIELKYEKDIEDWQEISAPRTSEA